MLVFVHAARTASASAFIHCLPAVAIVQSIAVYPVVHSSSSSRALVQNSFCSTTSAAMCLMFVGAASVPQLIIRMLVLLWSQRRQMQG
jgi:hypothetical protein